MAEAAHSKWSASGFEQRMLCPGSHVLQQGKPNTSSKYAAEGTAAHQVLTWALQEDRPALAYLGRAIYIDETGKVCTPSGCVPATAVFTFEVDEDMAGHVQTTIDYVKDLMGDDGIVFADIRVNYSQYLDTPKADAWGTADVIIARGTELIVIDFKYGMGVEVSAESNPQMSLYGLGALQAYQGIAADFTKVRLAISQPRIKTAPSEYDLTVEELEAWGRGAARSAVNSCKNAESANMQAKSSWGEVFLRPGEKQCKFCRAKATCPALRDEVVNTTFAATAATPDEFADLVTTDQFDVADEQWLAACLSKADLIEDWCKAVRAEVERRLLAGDGVPGYKLVQGKRGARQWSDAKVVEETLKSMRVKVEDMYDFKLISPTSAEKLAKAETIGKRQWPKLQELIVQNEGKPHVAPASDPRAALDIKPAVDDFENISDDLA